VTAEPKTIIGPECNRGIDPSAGFEAPGAAAIIARPVIAFGCSIVTPHTYEERAKVGFERAAEPGSVILANAAGGSVARSFNLLFETAAKLVELEALVLVHEDAEIVDPEFCSKLRSAMSDPEVGVVGCVGSRGVRDIAWWDGAGTWNSAAYHYGEIGGGELRWQPDDAGPPGEVDTVYGVMMAFSPWVVRNLRFDESIALRHGYDFDICRQARRAGRKVVAADLQIAHHHALDVIKEPEVWVAAHMRAAELSDDSGPEDPNAPAWKERARRAEASAAAARLLAAAELLRLEARVKELAEQQEEFERSRSWRVTVALRRGNALRRSLAERITSGVPRRHTDAARS
jgi:GT2 family glycosyltransferase